MKQLVSTIPYAASGETLHQLWDLRSGGRISRRMATPRPIGHGSETGWAQPFPLQAVVEGRARKHIATYSLFTEHGPVVVDVKPLRRLSDLVVAFTFAWSRQAGVLESPETPGGCFAHFSDIQLDGLHTLAPASAWHSNGSIRGSCRTAMPTAR
ncbi:hypothetical protein ACQUSR_33790 [Streptomyces sp. P1-3]|uniref:hypothetical protein n=1 Tax=Streptomyces sp. P1-3 TaxID=3421658 RepID=UPI003D35EC62